jgi:hypothetical protein
MRLSIIFILLTLSCFHAFFAYSSGCQKEKKEVEIKLYLDDAQLENPEYYNKLPVLSLESFATALLTPKTTNFKIINHNYQIARADSKIAEEMIAVSLGMRQEFVKVEAEGKSLLSGNLEGSEAEISEAMKTKLEDLKNNKAQLSESQKVYFLSGFIFLTSSIIREKIVLESTKMFVNEAKKC